MILTEIGKFLGAKVATAIIFVAVAAGGIWCWRNPEALKAGANAVTLALLWLGVAAALPWTSFLFIKPLLAKQAKMQTAGGAAMLSLIVLAVFLLAEIIFAFYLAGWSVSGTLSWLVLILGFSAAGAYNFVICESLARRADG